MIRSCKAPVPRKRDGSFLVFRPRRQTAQEGDSRSLLRCVRLPAVLPENRKSRTAAFPYGGSVRHISTGEASPPRVSLRLRCLPRRSTDARRRLSAARAGKAGRFPQKKRSCIAAPLLSGHGETVRRESRAGKSTRRVFSGKVQRIKTGHRRPEGVGTL